MLERMLLLVLFLLGFWALMALRNIIKKIFGLTIINSSVVLLFILEGAGAGQHAPIMEEGIRQVVDPLPQALMLTAIVIGVCITALALALALRLYALTGSFDIDEVRQRLGDEA